MNLISHICWLLMLLHLPVYSPASKHAESSFRFRPDEEYKYRTVPKRKDNRIYYLRGHYTYPPIWKPKNTHQFYYEYTSGHLFITTRPRPRLPKFTWSHTTTPSILVPDSPWRGNHNFKSTTKPTPTTPRMTVPDSPWRGNHKSTTNLLFTRTPESNESVKRTTTNRNNSPHGPSRPKTPTTSTIKSKTNTSPKSTTRSYRPPKIKNNKERLEKERREKQRREKERREKQRREKERREKERREKERRDTRGWLINNKYFRPGK